jgi:hypothetical protein
VRRPKAAKEGANDDAVLIYGRLRSEITRRTCQKTSSFFLVWAGLVRATPLASVDVFLSKYLDAGYRGGDTRGKTETKYYAVHHHFIAGDAQLPLAFSSLTGGRGRPHVSSCGRSRARKTMPSSSAW